MLKVTCAIIEYKQKVLVTQRSETMTLPLKWEFPGGKIEDGETAEACLIREIREELSVSIGIKQPLMPITHQYPGQRIIQLMPFVCEYTSGELKLSEHATIRWLTKSELANLDWAEADIPILNQYLNK